MTGWLCGFRNGSVARMAFWWALNAASARNDSCSEAHLGMHISEHKDRSHHRNCEIVKSAQFSGLCCQVRVVRQAFPSEIGLREIRGLEYTASLKTRGEVSW
jgi:hypothetical protein